MWRRQRRGFLGLKWSNAMSMFLRDGRCVDDLVYDGGSTLSVKVWGSHSDDESPQWDTVPLSSMPSEWLQDVRSAADTALAGYA